MKLTRDEILDEIEYTEAIGAGKPRDTTAA
jgi:hypothetical protein